MKQISIKLNLLFIIAFIFALTYLSVIKGQGLQQSHHDFSGGKWGNNSPCLPCHPVQSDPYVSNTLPLWNLLDTNINGRRYSSNTLDSQPGFPSGKSKICLACHDGTVAKESHLGTYVDSVKSSFGNHSIELLNDHPISFLYNNDLVRMDAGLYDPDTTKSGLGGTIAEDLLENGMMECTSCHDVHLSRNTEGCNGCHIKGTDGKTRTVSLSLWKSNVGSALCLTCHKK